VEGVTCISYFVHTDSDIGLYTRSIVFSIVVMSLSIHLLRSLKFFYTDAKSEYIFLIILRMIE